MKKILLAFGLMFGATLGACHGWYEVHEEHIHADGCGHYYWHNAWYNSPHPHGCCQPVHRHYDGCGHYNRHGTWNSHRHHHGCCGGW